MDCGDRRSNVSTPPDCGPKVWFVRTWNETFPYGTPTKPLDGAGRMTEIEAVHLAATLDEEFPKHRHEAVREGE